MMAAKTATATVTAAVNNNNCKIALIGRTMYRTFRNVWMLEELGMNQQYNHILAHPRSKLANKYHDLGKVPVLIIDEKDVSSSSQVVKIIESSAINTYLGDKYCCRRTSSLCSESSSTTSKDDNGNKQINNNDDNNNNNRMMVMPKPPRPMYDQLVSMIITELDASLWIHRKHETLGKVFGHSEIAVKEAKRNFVSTNHILINQLMSNMSMSIQVSSKRMDINNNNNNVYFLLGKDFTPVDILYVHVLDWAESIGWDDNGTWGLQTTKEGEQQKQEQEQEQLLVETKLNLLQQYLQKCRSRQAYINTVKKKNDEIFHEKEKKKEDKARNSSKL